ncbi:MAG TPA: PHB depolymerase family esterase [Thermomicrobiales bacterium]|nr:PHB depolymerase family esterase [Thermomicrobiales bacterium]
MRKLVLSVAALLASTIMSIWSIALPVSAAGARDRATPVPAGAASTQQSITVSGTKRTYLVYVPASAPASGAPLVVMMHGGGGSAAQAEKDYGWDQEADREGFIVAYPDGLNHAWNVGGGCCGQPGTNGTDDVAFITAMVAAIETKSSVDPSRVYATGISNGGMMSYRLACDTDLFAAIGPDSATMLGECPSPKPISVIHIHGTADTKIRYNGGPGTGTPETIDGPAVPALNATWRKIDDCAAPTFITAGKVTTSIASCPDDRTVELISVAGAGHQWPGGAPHPLRTILVDADPPSDALNATSTIWTFFAAHPKAASA